MSKLRNLTLVAGFFTALALSKCDEKNLYRSEVIFNGYVGKDYFVLRERWDMGEFIEELRVKRPGKGWINYFNKVNFPGESKLDKCFLLNPKVKLDASEHQEDFENYLGIVEKEIGSKNPDKSFTKRLYSKIFK